jgi:hypothetical protein
MNAYMISALNEVVTRDEDNVVEKRTPIGKDMPCMFNGEVAILLKTYFNNGLLTADVVTAKGEGWSVLYDTLQPY